MKKTIFVGLVLGMVTLAHSENISSQLIRIEEGQKAINQRIDDMNKRMDELKAEIKDVRAEIKDVRTELKDFMLWGFGILFVGMFSLVGFVLWDRRTTLTPIAREVKEVARQEGLIIEILRRFAQDEPRMAQAIKSAGLL